MAHRGCGREEVPSGLFAPVTGRDEAPRPVSGVVVRRCGFDRRPAPFSGQLSPWPAFGTPGGAWSRSGTGSRPGWGGPAFHTDAPELGLVPSFLGAAPHQFLALWSLGPLAFVLAAFLLPGFQLCWCRLYLWLRRPGLGRGLLPVGRLLFGLGVSGGCPAGGGRFLGPYPAVGLLEWEDVDKYMSFRRVHPRVGGATAKVRGGKKLKKGLSPRGRGNPMPSLADTTPAGLARGLSPRGRGNRHVRNGSAIIIRSIPAWAGEPPTAPASAPL